MAINTYMSMDMYDMYMCLTIKMKKQFPLQYHWNRLIDVEV